MREGPALLHRGRGELSNPLGCVHCIAGPLSHAWMSARSASWQRRDSALRTQKSSFNSFLQRETRVPRCGV